MAVPPVHVQRSRRDDHVTAHKSAASFCPPVLHFNLCTADIKDRAISRCSMSAVQRMGGKHGRAKSSLPRCHFRRVRNGSGSSPVDRAAFRLRWQPRRVHACRSDLANDRTETQFLIGLRDLCGLLCICSSSSGDNYRITGGMPCHSEDAANSSLKSLLPFATFSSSSLRFVTVRAKSEG